MKIYWRMAQKLEMLDEVDTFCFFFSEICQEYRLQIKFSSVKIKSTRSMNRNNQNYH